MSNSPPRVVKAKYAKQTHSILWVDRLKRVSLRVVTGLVLTAILLTALAAYFAWAATPSADIWISPGMYPGAAAFTIWRDGSNYFAKNQYGYIPFSGTNASDVLQDCINLLVTNGAAWQYNKIDVGARILFLSSLILTAPIDATDIINLEFVGVGRDHGIEFVIQHSSDMAFDFTNCRYLQFRNIGFKVASGYTPKTCIYLARGSDGSSSGDTVFDNCVFEDAGGVTAAFIYNYGWELMTFRECAFRAKGTMLDLNRDNYRGIDSLFQAQVTGTQSISMQSFRDCVFYCDNMETEPVKLNAGVLNTVWDHCYFGGGAGNYTFYMNCSQGSVHKTTVRNCHFEMMGFTGEGGTITRELVGLTFIDNTIWLPSAAGYVFMDLNQTNLNCREFEIYGNYHSRSGGIVHIETGILDYSYIDYRLGCYDFTLNSSSNIRYSRIVVESSSHITCTGGYVAVNGTYFSNGASFP